MKKGMKKRVILCLFVIGLFIGSSITSTVIGDEKKESTGLSHVREGGTPYNPNQSLYPSQIELSNTKDSPTSGLIASPPEYSPCQGVLYNFNSAYQSTVVRDLVVALTQDDQYDEIAYVWVSSISQKNQAINMFTTGGANMSKVEFIVEPIDSIWMRDYGPHFIWQNDTLGIVDSHYYPTRDDDNFVPSLLGDDYFNIPTYDIGLYYSGGNFQPGPDRSGFVTELVNNDNPSSQGFNESFIAELYQSYQGIDTLHIMPQLPGSVDGTGHIDMWMNIVDEDTVIISKFQPGSNPTAIQITENAVPYMEGLGFEVYRTPAWNVGGTHYTYTNAFRVNNRYFIPYYDSGNPSYADEDDEAYANFSAAAGPWVEIIPIDCYDIIPAAGAIHCIVMQVPRYSDPEPSVHVLWPDGGEILVGGTMQVITWSASDTKNQELSHFDLYYSTNNGSTYQYIDTTTNNGFYEWLVPDSLYTAEAKIKVIATAVDSDQGEAVSMDPFIIAPGDQTIYDFSTGAGIDKFCWGSQTSSWDSSIDEIRKPVNTEINTIVSDAYERIAYSDATGGDSDSNRYISTDPSSTFESTHIFEFTISEDPAEIDCIEVTWEGYADYCSQIELYVWDYNKNQWSDTSGFSGQNRFSDNWAGNRDDLLTAKTYTNIDYYIDGTGKLTILTYVERGSYQSYHDYISVTVSCIQTNPVLSYNPMSHDFQIMYANDTDSTFFEIWNSGSGMINYTVSESCDWLQVDPNIGNSSGEHDIITVIVNTTDLSPNTYHYDIIINSDAGNGVFGVDVEVVEEGTPIIDIDQSVFDRGFPIRHAADGDWAGAQDFTPTLSVITSVDVYLRKFGTPEFDLVVELREDHPTGTLIDTMTFTPGEVDSSWGYLSIDFIDESVDVGTDYFIVIPPAPSGVTTSFGYEWGYAFGNQYDDGAFWFTRDGGGLWRDLPTMYEFVFRTYGYN